MLSVPAQDLKAVLPFRADQDVRYYLNGVLVKPCEGGGCLLVATDGHTLAVYRSEEAWTDKARILKINEDMEKALRKATTLHSARRVAVADEKARVVFHDERQELHIQPGDAFVDYDGDKYPDFYKVIPPVEHLKPGTLSSLNAEYLGWLESACHGARWIDVRFWHDGRKPEEGVTVARFGPMPGLVVLIMAMRSKHEFTWPDWMPREPQATEPAPEESAA
jgi:hypothetical protein